MGRKNPIDFISLKIFITLAFLAICTGVVIGFQPRIFEFSADQPFYNPNDQKPVNVNWQVSFFSTDITLESPDQKYHVEPNGQMAFYPTRSGKYLLTSSNWISRLFNIRHVKQIDINLIKSVSTTAPDFSLSASKQAMNSYEIAWHIDAGLDNPVLKIGNEVFPIEPAQLTGKKNVDIKEDTIVILSCNHKNREQRKTTSLSFEGKEFKIKRFVVWLPASGQIKSAGVSASYGVKFAELIPLDNSNEYKVVKVIPSQTLNPGESVLVEWEVEGADSLMIEPVSKEVLPKKGASTLILNQSTNVILNAVANGKKITYTIPLVVNQQLLKTRTPAPTTVRYYGSGTVRTAVPSTTTLSIPKPKAPVIEFFRVNPTSIKEPGKIILSWSVSGDWTRIQLLTSQLISTGVGHEERTLTQTNTTTVTENLPPSGFLIFDVRGGTSFILRAWNGSSVDSASADIRFDDPAVKKLGTTTKILELFPAVQAYYIGDEVTVSVQVTDTTTGVPVASGSLIVTDGISYCQISLPKGSCDLLIRREGQYDIEAYYYGTATYLASESKVAFQSAIRPKENTVIKANFLPDSRSFYLKDSYIVSAGLFDLSGASLGTEPTGTLFISDGFENCLLSLPRNSCSFSPKVTGERVITITYSGDKTFAPSTLVTPVTITAIPVAQHPLTLEILSLFPQKEAYAVGDSIDIYLKAGGVLPGQNPSGKIEVTDGYATCSISFASDNHCTLRLISAAASQIFASYTGDEIYSAADAVPLPIQVDALPKKPVRVTIAQVAPAQAIYKINDQLDVTVSVASQADDQPVNDGTVTVSDGFSSCEVFLKEKTSCRLSLTNGAAQSITAVFSGTEVYSSATSEPHAIKLLMTTLSASLQPLIYQDCETSSADSQSEVQVYTDYSQTPPVDGFFLNDQFTVGNGFVIRAVVESLAGNFPVEIGTIQAKLCSMADSSYCYESDPLPLMRHPDRLTAANADLEIPALAMGGNYQLTLHFVGDAASFGSNERTFTLFNIRPGKLVLSPAGTFSPAESYSAYFWSGLEAADLQAASYDFDAYLLLGGLPQCAVAIDPAIYPRPSSASLDLSVDSALVGSNLSDSDWKSAFLTQGYPQSLVDRLQPNRMVWNAASCAWVNGSESWRLSCREVGINEPSLIRFALEQTDTNYTVVDNDLDGLSDIPVIADVSKYMSGVQMPVTLSSVQQGAPYWLNNSGASFGYWVVERCPDEYLMGNLTMSSTIPASQSVRFVPFALTRSLASSDFRFQQLDGNIQLSSETNPGMLSVLSEYHGICSSCRPAVMMRFPSILNQGCSQGDAGEIIVSGNNGTLFGGNRCETTEYGTEMIQSSFCQIAFAGGGELLARFEGNDLFLPSQATQTISITGSQSAPMISSAEGDGRQSLYMEETPAVEQQQPMLLSEPMVSEELFSVEQLLTTATPVSDIPPEQEPDAGPGSELDDSLSTSASAAASSSTSILPDELTGLEFVLPEPDQQFEITFDGFRSPDGIYELPNHFQMGTQASVQFTISPYLPAGELGALVSVSQNGESVTCDSSGNEVLCQISTICEPEANQVCTGFHQVAVNFFGSGQENPAEMLIIEYLVEPAVMGIIFPEDTLQSLEDWQLFLQEIQAQLEIAPSDGQLAVSADDLLLTIPVQYSLDPAAAAFVIPENFLLEIELDTNLNLDPIELSVESFEPASQRVTFSFSLPEFLNEQGYTDWSQALTEISGIMRISAIYSGDETIQPSAAEILFN